MDATRNRGGFGAANAGAGVGMTPIASWQPPPPHFHPRTFPKNSNHAPPKDAPPKTPISLLQEACLRKGTTPVYELISTEGQVHEPTFMYRVTVDGRLGQGSGKSKKVAKHLAAKVVLEELVREGVWGEWGVPGGTREEAVEYLGRLVAGLGKEERRGGDAGPEEGNTVGKLQERCNQLKWPVPEYSLEETLGQPHERLYRVSVSIGKLSARSEAKSKKAAKRQAAELMLTQISNLKAQEGFDEDDLVDRLKRALKSLGGGGKKLRGGAKDLAVLESFFGPLVGAQARALRGGENRAVGGAEALRLLTLIAQENHFTTTFLPVSHTTHTGQAQCLVQLSTIPVAVCHGSGPNEKEAQYAAAKNALEYLKIMATKAQETQ